MIAWAVACLEDSISQAFSPTSIYLHSFSQSFLPECFLISTWDGIVVLFRDKHSNNTYSQNLEHPLVSAFTAVHYKELHIIKAESSIRYFILLL